MYKLFESYGIHDVLIRIQNYVDEFNGRFTLDNLEYEKSFLENDKYELEQYLILIKDKIELINEIKKYAKKDAINVYGDHIAPLMDRLRHLKYLYAHYGFNHVIAKTINGC